MSKIQVGDWVRFGQAEGEVTHVANLSDGQLVTFCQAVHGRFRGPAPNGPVLFNQWASDLELIERQTRRSGRTVKPGDRVRTGAGTVGVMRRMRESGPHARLAEIAPLGELRASRSQLVVAPLRDVERLH